MYSSCFSRGSTALARLPRAMMGRLAYRSIFTISLTALVVPFRAFRTYRESACHEKGQTRLLQQKNVENEVRSPKIETKVQKELDNTNAPMHSAPDKETRSQGKPYVKSEAPRDYERQNHPRVKAVAPGMAQSDGNPPISPPPVLNSLRMEEPKTQTLEMVSTVAQLTRKAHGASNVQVFVQIQAQALCNVREQALALVQALEYEQGQSQQNLKSIVNSWARSQEQRSKLPQILNAIQAAELVLIQKQTQAKPEESQRVMRGSLNLPRFIKPLMGPALRHTAPMSRVAPGQYECKVCHMQLESLISLKLHERSAHPMRSSDSLPDSPSFP